MLLAYCGPYFDVEVGVSQFLKCAQRCPSMTAILRWYLQQFLRLQVSMYVTVEPNFFLHGEDMSVFDSSNSAYVSRRTHWWC